VKVAVIRRKGISRGSPSLEPIIGAKQALAKDLNCSRPKRPKTETAKVIPIAPRCRRDEQRQNLGVTAISLHVEATKTQSRSKPSSYRKGPAEA